MGFFLCTDQDFGECVSSELIPGHRYTGRTCSETSPRWGQNSGKDWSDNQWIICFDI